MNGWLRGVAAFVLAAGSLITGQDSLAQGGPPMITDDPGTPGDRKWEINLAITFERRRDQTGFDAPAIDLNYGVGDHIQLTLQGGPALLKQNGHGVIGGLGATEAAMKWRFLDEETSGCDVSMFPRVIFNVVQASVHRGLADAGTRFQIPFQASKKLARFHIDGEFGPVVSTVGRSEWLYGIVGGLEYSKKATVMAELHGRCRTDFSRDLLTANVGMRYELSEPRILIASVGHELRNAEEPLAFIGYIGVQLLY